MQQRIAHYNERVHQPDWFAKNDKEQSLRVIAAPGSEWDYANRRNSSSDRLER